MTERELRQIGALLHDIGKFSFRARPLEPNQTHEHLGDVFVRTVIASIAAFEQDVVRIADYAKRASQAIYSADTTTARERQPQIGGTTRRYVVAIASRVQIELAGGVPKAPLPEGAWYIAPEPLAQQAPMPFARPSDDEPVEQEAIAAHDRSWQAFCTELGSFSQLEDAWAAIETLYSLLEKYTATVTSAAYRTLPDISLFDHAKVVAALSHCNAEGKRGAECLLITGDLSGIQSFLYSNLGDAASRAKLLRGRSLLVRLVADSIVAFLLDRLGLYRSSVLYNGGGTFELLVPNSDANRSIVERAQRDIARLFARKLGFALQISIAQTTCSAEELMTDYAAVRRRVADRLQKAKRQRFLDSLDVLFDDEEFPTVRSQLDRWCIALGETAPKASYLVELRGVQSMPAMDATIAFEPLRIGWAIADSDQLRMLLRRQYAERAIVYTTGDTDLASVAQLVSSAAMPTAVGFRFIGSYVPRNDDGSICTFQQLAERTGTPTPLLAFARMDLDSLGFVMRTGLHERSPDERKYTVSRVVSLSRALDHFFSGTVPALAEKHGVYLVYSGGDDLFAVGSWTAILAFARTLRTEFDRFVCGNRNLTLSCGIAITDPYFPVDRAAKKAGQLEELAKNGLAIGGPIDPKERLRKDRVALLDCAMHWDTLDYWIEFGDQLVRLVDGQQTDERLPRSLVHRLLELTQSTFDRTSGGIRLRTTSALARAIAGLRYAFARRGLTAPKRDEWQRTIQGKLVENLLKVSDAERPNNWWNFRVTARYVLWKTRSNTP